jgi:hypothetical protein
MAPGLGLYLDEVFFENYNINQAKQALLHSAKAKPLTDTETVAVDADTCADSIPNKIEEEKPLGDTENVAVDDDMCANSVPNDVTEGAASEVVDNEPVSTNCLFEQTNIFFN